MSQKSTATHERVDDIPLISAQLTKMRVAAWLAHPCRTNGNWTGWSRGWVTVVWVPCLLSAGAHRLSHVEPWLKAQQRTLSRCRGSRVTPHDGPAERLARVREAWRVPEHWGACACALHQHVIRVYHLHARMARVASTTVAAFVTPAELFPCGHSQD